MPDDVVLGAGKQPALALPVAADRECLGFLQLSVIGPTVGNQIGREPSLSLRGRVRRAAQDAQYLSVMADATGR